MATKPEFLVAKEKLLVALATISVAMLSPVSQTLFCGKPLVASQNVVCFLGLAAH